MSKKPENLNTSGEHVNAGEDDATGRLMRLLQERTEIRWKDILWPNGPFMTLADHRRILAEQVEAAYREGHIAGAGNYGVDTRWQASEARKALEGGDNVRK